MGRTVCVLPVVPALSVVGASAWCSPVVVADAAWLVVVFVDRIGSDRIAAQRSAAGRGGAVRLCDRRDSTGLDQRAGPIGFDSMMDNSDDKDSQQCGDTHTQRPTTPTQATTPCDAATTNRKVGLQNNEAIALRHVEGANKDDETITVAREKRESRQRAMGGCGCGDVMMDEGEVQARNQKDLLASLGVLLACLGSGRCSGRLGLLEQHGSVEDQLVSR